MSIVDAMAQLQEEIAAACRAAGRDPREITLVAVSKTYPASAIRDAYDAGIREIGENRVQEILVKKPELEDLPLHWHMIGTLQSNKVRAILPHVALLHSLDRPSLADAIAQHSAMRGGEPLPALLQVNTTGEETKSGAEPEEVDALLDHVRGIPAIRVLGFMTIGPLGGNEAEIRKSFALLRSLRDRSRNRHPDLDLSVLSMGMSDDFPLAIREGATHLRIGSRLFGSRRA